MKLPGDVSASRLIRVLEHLGYQVLRQRGSHIRLRHDGPPQHSVSVPNHDPLKKGTLHGIVSEVARARSMLLEDLIGQL
ncbi:type II toxin-antitoxin system HicA family toxin [Occallatibacter riparius]|uniref:Type II toxin-antitoxin system HicA family toxin n=1 Tax=Occallatibacter riparius TaxID=1002689 RepID=A0A9J7BH89_9BACT|nr:type II toxin-antitoxin system HicA family toxin [Occallatibacter riparius]UWZ82152.1 type II toxin-antitoxin system HicA family toxin [Occallatibacter riparius]